ncbi:hypothetical protein G4B88_030608 [Cannabis sativa]|uniref:Myb/SANT-like domain-containing protein n=1 Tax=Cannabis sativa TaxID=3483 RepID=A0A7J6H8M6_CANSA|nr:hypothetical protein G4B88_030608 [Cannabis sativa]
MGRILGIVIIKYSSLQTSVYQLDTSKVKGPGQNKRFWTEEEDTKLIESLLEMHNEGTFKAEGNFKPGYLKAFERALATKIPGCDLQARPHIDSRMKTLKTHFQIVHEMLTGPNCSGFGWDPEKQMVTAEKPVWEAYYRPRAPPIQSDGSSKKKQKSSSLGDIAEAIKDASQFIGEKIEMSFVRLSHAIGVEMNDKQMRKRVKGEVCGIDSEISL